MSILSDNELRYIGSDILEPFDPDLVQPASIDLRLGYTFRRFTRDYEGGVIDLDDIPDQDQLSEPINLGPRGYVIIHPGEFMLGSTLEVIRVPPNLTMEIVGKSTLARIGLLPHVEAGYFDPGWRGIGTLELANLGKHPIKLRPGRRICQSKWQTMSSVPRNLYGSAALGSHYQDATGVEGAKA